mgnify:CR=1 FL=1
MRGRDCGGRCRSQSRHATLQFDSTLSDGTARSSHQQNRRVVGKAIAVGENLDSLEDRRDFVYVATERRGQLFEPIPAEVWRLSLVAGRRGLLNDPVAHHEQAVTDGVAKCYLNSGQTCSALTRMLVPRDKLEQVESIAAVVAES